MNTRVWLINLVGSKALLFFVKSQKYLVYSTFYFFLVLLSETLSLEIINRLLSFYFVFCSFRDTTSGIHGSFGTLLNMCVWFILL